MNLICYLCKKEIIASDKTAKIISIQHDGTDARIEYINNQEDTYIHLDCLKTNNVPIIHCPANNENFAHDFSIINKTKEILDSGKNESTDLLIRSDILNFLKGNT